MIIHLHKDFPQYHAVGDFLVSVGERKYYMAVDQHARPNRATPLQSVWSMVLSMSDLFIYFCCTYNVLIVSLFVFSLRSLCAYSYMYLFLPCTSVPDSGFLVRLYLLFQNETYQLDSAQQER